MFRSKFYIQTPTGEKHFEGDTVSVKHKHKDGECEIFGKIERIIQRGLYLNIGQKTCVYVAYKDITGIRGAVKGVV